MGSKLPVRKIKRLFYDLETSPNVVLAFRAGYDLNIEHNAIISERKIICVGYKWEGDARTHILRWDADCDDRSLLVDFLKIASEADELVAHFGDRFDLPWVRTRCLIHGLEPLPFFKTIDTKAWASKNFYFNSNRLDYLGKVLGFGGKDKMEFDDWKEIVLNTSKFHMDKMCRYCAKDVIRLEQVFSKLKCCVKPKTHAGVFAGGEKWSCAHCGSENVAVSKRRVTANGTVQYQMKCNVGVTSPFPPEPTKIT